MERKKSKKKGARTTCTGKFISFLLVRDLAPSFDSDFCGAGYFGQPIHAIFAWYPLF
jgi:hypothetical protein